MKLFVDLDGVLADFDQGMKDNFGLFPDEFETVGKMWKAAATHPSFFGTLPLMQDAIELWTVVKRMNPTILTGVPYGNWAPDQKRSWVATNFGDVPVITCYSKDKYTHGVAGDILIDDRIKAKAPWEDMGGTFIHHTTAQKTISELSSYAATRN